MHNIHWKILIILAALGLSLWSLLSEGVKLGKDLRGGLSLIYQLNIPDDVENPDELVQQTIEVLKNRVNPQGVLDISIVAQGRDRIEITMPLPSEEVKQKQDQLEQLLREVLDRARIDPAQLQLDLRAGTAVEEWAPSEDNPFRQRLVDLQEAYDEQEAAGQAYQAAKDDPDIAQGELDRLEAAYAEAVVEYEELFNAVVRRSVTEADLRRMLKLSTQPREQTDAQGETIVDDEGQPVLEPSPRATELQALQERFPHLEEELARLVEVYDEYQSMRTGFDDPEDLKRLLRGAGVLEFRIAVEAGEQHVGFNVDQMREDLAERGPEARTSNVVTWMPINDLKQWYEEKEQLARLQADPVTYFAANRGLVAAEHGGDYYLLIYDIPGRKLTHEAGMGDWSLKSAGRTTDSLGRPAVRFELDSAGGIKMRQLTGNNINKPMAIVLDGEVYSAPNINSQIGSNGIIEGNFSRAEIDYLIRVLASGSLEARLSPEPIAQNVLGPSIGADNLTRGLYACVIGLIAVAIFMMSYYFFAGAVADFALLCNGVLIFGIMSMQQAAFTLPGIAGIVLTIGMAVDANVLIYERIREEFFAGEEDLKTAIRLGYSKALSTIIDANVTNLIVCFVLYQTATAEVKGFALTLGIGILATLFTALFVTRVIYTIYTEVFGMRTLPMLPTVIPAVHRALEPNINWIGLRKIFQPISAVLVACAVLLVISRGATIYDTEFRGGVSATFQTRPATQVEIEDPDIPVTETTPPRLMLDRADVERRIQEIGEENPNDELLNNFLTASVLAAGANQRGSLSEMFQVKVTAQSQDTAVTSRIVSELVEEFSDALAETPSHDFAGKGLAMPPRGATFPVTERARLLGQVIDRSGYDQIISPFSGGVVVVIEQIDPPVTLQEVTDRINTMRRQQDYIQTADRQFEVFGLNVAETGEGYTSIAVAVTDDRYGYYKDRELWETELANVEWQLITDALSEPAQLEQMNSYSSSVAQTLAAGAVVAVALSLLGILVYIWIRFGSLWYSLAAIAALVHDVCIALGLLAASFYISGTPIGTMLGIEDFRIDLGVVAALLTIIGYSLNDTIVILDRIRENRGKLPIATAETVNLSINQTVSRTLLTSSTTLLAVLIMYIEGGTGIRPFTFTLLAGLLVGTYSSVAIAAPLVYGKSGPTAVPADEELKESPESDTDALRPEA